MFLSVLKRRSVRLMAQFQTESKQMVRTIISIFQIFTSNSQCYIYGGYIRDGCASQDFRDIDMHFPSRWYVDQFVREVRKKLPVNLFEDESNGPILACVGTEKVFVMLEISFSNPRTGPELDLDINTLRTVHKPNGKFDLMTPYCDLLEVMNHCVYKEFVVVDSGGKFILKHTACDGCIDRNSPYGTRILEKIIKMKSRGWKCLSQPCANPQCVMAYTEHPIYSMKSCELTQPAVEKKSKRKISREKHVNKRTKPRDLALRDYIRKRPRPSTKN